MLIFCEVREKRKLQPFLSIAHVKGKRISWNFFRERDKLLSIFIDDGSSSILLIKYTEENDMKQFYHFLKSLFYNKVKN